MIMCTLLSMVYRLFKPCWLIDVSCTCFRETTPLFNMHLTCFKDFILYPTDKYMFKVNNKKNLINLLNVFKVKSKYVMTLFKCIYCWPGPQSAYQYSVFTFNFKEAFVSSVRKTSHNVLKKQKERYLYRNNNCETYFYSTIYHCTELKLVMNIWQYFSSKFALRIPSVLWFSPVTWSAISSLFHRNFLAV